MNVIDEIAAERKRQIEREGWSQDHDDSHTDESLAQAAACYASPRQMYTKISREGSLEFTDPWPWPVLNRGERIRSFTGWAKDGKSRRRQLVIAAALIVAEIERLDRLTRKATEGETNE